VEVRQLTERIYNASGGRKRKSEHRSGDVHGQDPVIQLTGIRHAINPEADDSAEEDVDGIHEGDDPEMELDEQLDEDENDFS